MRRLPLCALLSVIAVRAAAQTGVCVDIGICLNIEDTGICANWTPTPPPTVTPTATSTPTVTSTFTATPTASPTPPPWCADISNIWILGGNPLEFAVQEPADLDYAILFIDGVEDATWPRPEWTPSTPIPEGYTAAFVHDAPAAAQTPGNAVYMIGCMNSPTPVDTTTPTPTRTPTNTPTPSSTRTPTDTPVVCSVDEQCPDGFTCMTPTPGP